MATTWVEKGNLRGPKGDTGATGEKGDVGVGFRSANIELSASASVPLTNITPSDGIQTGDTLVDSVGALWQVASVSAGTSVTVFLMNGFQMHGVVKGYDSFVVLLDSDGKPIVTGKQEDDLKF